MSLTPRQIAGIAVATLSLTVPASCSKGESTQAPKGSSVPTQPNTPGAPDSTPGPVKPNIGTPIPYSINCGNRSAQDATNPGVFSGEHFSIANNTENQAQLKHVRLPLDAAYDDGSDKAFIDAIEASRVSLTETIIPTNVDGSVIISYPGTQPGQVQKYQITTSQDGTITVSPNPELKGTVAIQSFTDQLGYLINLAALENTRGDSAISFLNPGDDEWDNVADAPKDPKSNAQQGFTKINNGKDDTRDGIYLNKPISRYGPTLAGVQNFDPGAQAACQITTDGTRRSPEIHSISLRG